MPSPDRPLFIGGASSGPIEILFEDNHLLVVDKPAGLLVQPDATGDASLFDLVAAYRRHREGKPGNAFVGIVHRLDRPVSGIVVVAKTSKAAARLARQFRDGTVQKTYWAAVDASTVAGKQCLATLATASTVWRDRLAKDFAKNVARIVRSADEKTSESRLAETAVRLLQTGQHLSLLELKPISGRAHQLRVQCSSRGLPIIGDQKYGSPTRLGRAIALHAVSLHFAHPISQTISRFAAPAPPSWSKFGFDLMAAFAATSTL